LGKLNGGAVVAALSYSSSLFVEAVTRSHALRGNVYLLRCSEVGSSALVVVS